MEATYGAKKNEFRNRKRDTSTVAQLAGNDTHEYKRLRLDTPSDPLAPMYNPLAGTASSNIRLIGSMELPHPDHCGFDVLRVEQILDLLPHLQKIDNRDLRSMFLWSLLRKFAYESFVKALTNRIDLSSGFESFKTKEEQAWKDSGDTPEKRSCLVPPSGSLDSVIAHHLHQPSFTTRSWNSGDTADQSNGCIAMVMGNGFQEGETLLFDHLHRRSVKSEGLDQYPQAVINAHEEFTYQIMASSAAKVEVVYGRTVQKRILQTMKCCILPLWDRFSGVLLVLLYESNFNNAEEEFMFRKIIFFATHPQHMFYQQQGSPVAVRQDLTFEAASCVADLKVELDLEYYQLKRWRSKVPTVYDLAQLKAKDHLSLQDVEDALENPEPEPKGMAKRFDVQDGEWHSYFDQYPHSNNATKKLLPAAIKTTMLVIESDCKDWHDPSQFPPAVLDWFKGQKDVLFYHGPVSSTKDIEFAFKRCVDVEEVKRQNIHGEESHRLQCMLHQLMLKQQHHLVSHTCVNDDLLFNRVDGSTVETVCPCGAFETVDNNPRFTCAQAGGYVMRTSRRCKSQQCSEKKPDQKNSPQLHMKPVSSDLEGVIDLKECLRAEKRRNRIYLHRALLREKGEGPPRPTVINSWCCRCKEKTKVGGSHANEEGNMYIDDDAQWTYGNVRPLYCVREARCHNCAGGGRFVPTDPDVAFTDHRQLTAFQTGYGKYDMAVKAVMLDNWPSLSTEPRPFRR